MSKLDILFYEPDSSKNAYQDLSKIHSAIETPTWSLLLAQSCRTKGFDVGILDSTAERLSDEKTIEKIKYLNPKILCVVVYGQNPNSGTTNMIGAERLCKKLKEDYSNSFVVLVGSHVSALPKEVLKNDFVDCVLLNEGVYALHDLANSNLSLTSLRKIKGIGYKDEDGKLILNEPQIVVPQDRMDIDLPGYAWDLLPYDKNPLDLYRAHFWHTGFSHENRTPFAAIYTTLGCRFSCDFCMINILNRVNNDEDINSSHSSVMRGWSHTLLLEEFEKLANFGVETIRISDEMFFLNKNYYEPLLNGIIDRGLKFNLWAYSRVDTVKERYLDLFKNAGINWLALGIESGNQNVRLEISKGKFKEVHIKEVVQTIQSHDINVLGNYIFGFPNEDFKEMQETLDLAIDLNTEHANFYPCQALPGSPLYTQAKIEGWKLPDSYEGYAFLSYESEPLPTRFRSASEVLEFRDNAWQKYFTNQNFLSLVEKKFGTQQKENLIEMTKISLKRKLLGH